jgi:hypothetical protein
MKAKCIGLILCNKKISHENGKGVIKKTGKGE